ncbi:hypothetical protein COP2_042601 [Malus domestica]
MKPSFRAPPHSTDVQNNPRPQTLLCDPTHLSGLHSTQISTSAVDVTASPLPMRLAILPLAAFPLAVALHRSFMSRRQVLWQASMT